MNRLKCSAFACLLLPTISSATDITALDLNLNGWDIYGFSSTIGSSQSVNTHTGTFSTVVNNMDEPALLNYDFSTLNPSDVIVTITPGETNRSTKTIYNVATDIGISLSTIQDATTIAPVNGAPTSLPTNFAYIAKNLSLIHI